MTSVPTRARGAKRAKTTRPVIRGRVEVKQALLAAASELFAAHGPAAVSLRDIAQHAGVNHGLIHRHFGSKEALRREALDTATEEIAEQFANSGERDGTDEGADDLFDFMAERSEYWRMLARAILDGEDASDLQSEHPVMQQLLSSRAAESGDFDAAQVDVAALAALGLGWLIFEPFLVHALGMKGRDKKELRRSVMQRLAVLPGPGTS